MSQKPATRSGVTGNGPWLTLGSLPEYLIRAPFEVGCRPSPASMTPAFTISSLNLPIAVSSSALGITPASLFALAFTITMNRVVTLLLNSTRRAGRGISARQQDEQGFAAPTWLPKLFRRLFLAERQSSIA